MTYYSRTNYTGNGSQTAYTFSWDSANGHYMAASDVKASLDGVVTTAFTVVGNTLTFTSAPASGVAIAIYRQTSLAIIQTFARLGTPSSGGFNDVMRRIQYIGQEALDTAAATADAAYSALLASQWATLTSGLVAATDYSAKEYAQGSQASTGGSSKSWAQQTGADVTGASANSRSAKSWAQDSLEGVTLGGSAKNWAISPSKPDGVNESAKTYASQASASADAAATSEANAATSEANAAQSAIDAQTAAAYNYATVAETLTGTATNVAVSPDDLAAIWEQGTDIASASSLPVPSTGGGYFNVTGTTTITAISQAAALRAGRTIRFKFAGALTLTHNATSLILPTSANITTAAGDSAAFVCEDATNNYWRCESYNRADGTSLAGTQSVLVLQDQKSSGTDGGTSSAGAWTTRTLNTEVLDTGNISTLTSNQFTLPAGTYTVNGFMTFANGSQAKARLRNMTDGAIPVNGLNGATPAGTTGINIGITGGFTIASTKTFELQYWSNSGAATTGLGQAATTGTAEVYASLTIVKVA